MGTREPLHCRLVFQATSLAIHASKIQACMRIPTKSCKTRMARILKVYVKTEFVHFDVKLVTFLFL